MKRNAPDLGFTLIEVMMVVAIVGILAGIGGWGATALLPGYRADSAARKFISDVRSGQAIAMRLNDSAEIQLRLDAADGCSGPAYRLISGDVVYETVCLPSDFPGVSISAEGTAGFGVLGFGIDAQPTGGCSFCDDDGGRLVLYPTGEITDPEKPGADLAISFMPTKDVAPRNAGRLRAVGIRAGSARAKIYAADDTKWREP